mmetsp:Transcript_11163/g.18230  ORF Transcript_11163/g.18230 Transcript_11163/m.18230 type:complete len:271 (-) Transcript_11163:34-846(-)|eukprot:CAMPEP_0203770510 /NCGR_PEP_ID=MMETSP0099_2-20121227/2863_1 /ASSEMBLY_ACC=CAM_ASM_000209 /TAXON_ID=96639 /ORGANISM=" , Strain NY0313808BC1" /LENGTH=270 /DNA_ID=CAMNT_0050667679 /DNA_START=21 /DNA_END=833 /DNA_ORIENTATION=-
MSSQKESKQVGGAQSGAGLSSGSDWTRLMIWWVVLMGSGLVMGLLLPHPHAQARMFTKEELSKYDGEIYAGQRYLAILGQVFDVSSGEFYTPKGGYGYFVGKDASRAFTSGKFEGHAQDEITDLTNSEIMTVVNWLQFYIDHESYVYMGNVIGRYYDDGGNPTKDWEKILEVKEQHAVDMKKQGELEKLFPSCNSRWSQNDGSTVWCTDELVDHKTSSPLVPRLMFFEAHRATRCTCVELNVAVANTAKYKVYDGCDEKATTCKIVENKK